MGNPLSPILADIVLEKLFKEKLSLLEIKPTFIFKYVDDIILATSASNITKIQSLFNSFHEKLNFTVEIENNNTLSFLDLKLHRRNNKIITEWYKKDIASNTLLNFLSVHPYSMKKNVSSSFVKRALYLTDAEFRKQVITKIRNILQQNNYPIKLINNLITKSLYTYRKHTPKVNNNLNKFGSLPYIPNLTEKITKTLKQNSDNLVLASQITTKVSNNYSKLKDRIPIEENSGLVYKVLCNDCDGCYIGETSKTLNQRMKQHKSDVAHVNKLLNEPSHYRSALTKHTKELNHNFLLDHAIILQNEKNKNKRLFKEACQIWLAKDPVNYKVDVKRLHDNYINIVKNYS